MWQKKKFFWMRQWALRCCPESARDFESLFSAANAAMQVAKNTPGTSYRLAEKAFERHSSNALVQEQALRSGIESAEIYLAYQPKVDSHTGQLLSFEALARWDCPGVGSVSPVEFISIAGESVLVSLVRWARHCSNRRATRLRPGKPSWVCVCQWQ